MFWGFISSWFLWNCLQVNAPGPHWWLARSSWVHLRYGMINKSGSSAIKCCWILLCKLKTFNLDRNRPFQEWSVIIPETVYFCLNWKFSNLHFVIFFVAVRWDWPCDEYRGQPQTGRIGQEGTGSLYKDRAHTRGSPEIVWPTFWRNWYCY